MTRQVTTNTSGQTPLPPKTGNARADTLLGLTVEYVRTGGDDAPPEMRHYPAIALAMLPYVDLQTRARVAAMLADAPQLPNAVACSLAGDAIEAASPVLERCTTMSEGDLCTIARDHSPAHAMAIARRGKLPTTVIDALIARGDADIDAVLNRMHRGHMADDQITRLETRTSKTENPVKRTGARPPQAATALPDRTLSKLFWSGDREAREAVMTVMSRKPVVSIESLSQRFGELAGRVAEGLVQLANSRRGEDLIAGLARIGRIDRATAARILADQSGEPLAVAIAALGFDARSARALIGAVVPREANIHHRLVSDFDMLGTSHGGRLFLALCGHPHDETRVTRATANHVTHTARQPQPGARRATGTPARRRTEIAVSQNAS